MSLGLVPNDAELPAGPNAALDVAEAEDSPAGPQVSVLEDDPTLAALAADLCHGLGVSAAIYTSPAPCLEAARLAPPRVLVLDWRLEGQLGAATFMAVRHRYPRLPVVCWTASPAWHLPQMIRQDPMSRVVDKAAGAGGFEDALRWALAFDETTSEGAGDERPVSNPA